MCAAVLHSFGVSCTIRRLHCRLLLFVFALLLALFTLHIHLIGRSADSQIDDLTAYRQIEVPLARPLIPHLLHQTYRTAQVPREYATQVASWRATHPNYTYVFWSDADINRFVADKYPELRDMMAAYPHNLQRSDAARYLILLHYGGVYADMDIEALRPLTPLLRRHSCLLSREPFAQSMFIWSAPQSAMNALMACAPRHYFMNTMVRALPELAQRTHWKRALGLDSYHSYIIWSTGPMALTEVYERYMHAPPCSLFGNARCRVWLAPPRLLLPQLKQDTLDGMRSFCSTCPALVRNVFVWRDRACRLMERRRWDNSLPHDAYSRHLFSNLGYGFRAAGATVSIDSLVPDVRRYPNIPTV